jgi:hypothetical protein
MKTIKWEECKFTGSTGEYPPKDGRMLMPNDPVRPEMRVMAKYKGLSTYLKIKEEIGAEMFKAEVLFFEPVLALKPEDLFKGDEVLIDRAHICWLFG